MPQMRTVVAWNTTAQIIGRVVSALTTLGVTIIIARNFGTHGYGDFVKVTTFIAFFYLLADFGINAIYLQTEDTQWQELVSLRVFMSCILVFVALFILACIPVGLTQGYTSFVRIGILLFAPTIVFQALITSANAIFQKELRYDKATLAVTIGSVVSIFLVWSVQQSVLFVITALLVGSAVTSVVALWYARKFVRSPFRLLSTMKMHRLFIASIPLGLTLLFNLVYFHIDSVILTLTRTTSEVGIYGLVYKIFELPLVLPTFFMNSLYPVMLQVTGDKRQGKDKFISLITKSAIFLSLASCTLSLVVWLGSPLISWIRTDFVPGIPALKVLSLGFPFFFLSSLTMWTLITYKKQIALVYIYGISMALNILLNVYFVPQFGYIAAAWITVVSEAFVFIVSSVVVLRIL
jgi:O-antigen/teichoic acid export membrane protein